MAVNVREEEEALRREGDGDDSNGYSIVGVALIKLSKIIYCFQ